MNNKTINEIKDYIDNASNIFIVGHRGIDLDAIGACLALYYLSRSLNRSAYIIIEEKEYDSTIKKCLEEMAKRKINVPYYKYSNVEDKIDQNSLLFIIDCHKKELLQVPCIYEKIKNKIIIDHHSRNNDTEDNVYSVIKDKYSSTCEILADLLYYIDFEMPAYIYSIMLGGISIDTNNFSRRTNDNTYLTAANLIKLGATSSEVQYLLKEDVSEYFNIQNIIQDMFIIDGEFAICICGENIYSKEFLAKVSSTLLTFENIEMSFAIGRINETIVGISCRSIGNYDASSIMEKLNGGGSSTDAATQIEGTSVTKVRDTLIGIIKEG